MKSVSAAEINAAPAERDEIASAYAATRAASITLANPLTDEDQMLQSMTEASPTKWNLAHTTWFFETFILKRHAEAYSEFHPRFGYLFNSYYTQIGARHPRPLRGMLSRPSGAEVAKYRKHVDRAMEALVRQSSEETFRAILPLIDLGRAHEEQHQELLITDIKHAMSGNPLYPAIYSGGYATREDREATPQCWIRFEGGLAEIGANDAGFHFDNEAPRHQAYLRPFELAARPATNREFLEFIEDGGYERPEFWLADGWDVASREGWRAPLYWVRQADGWATYTLHGLRALDLEAPVSHVSYFEAAAFAEWTGFRLPTEQEWEFAACARKLEGRFLNPDAPREPLAASGRAGEIEQLFGDVWEWTQSPYTPYPGYRAPGGAIGEYNGKFMCNQFVLRGGSCATPEGHIRSSYRNFFQPEARWQFSGLRLARDI